MRSPQAETLRATWPRNPSRPGRSPDELAVSGATIERRGEIAYAAGVRLHQLSRRDASLEEAYLELTAGSVGYGVAR